MKIRAIQCNPGLGKIDENMDVHRKKIRGAIADRIDLIVFPELSISGYDLRDIVYEISQVPGSPVLEEFKKFSQKIDIIVGVPYEPVRGLIYNTAIYFSGGEIKHIHKKVQLPNFGMFQEAMIFKPGDEFMAFPLKDGLAGILICREILFPIHAYLYYLQNTDLLIGISNSPYRKLTSDHFASNQFWESSGYVFSMNFQQNYLFVNRTGFEDGVGFGGGSFFARAGEGITAKLPYLEVGDLDVEANLADVRRARLAGNYLRDERPEIILKEMNRIVAKID